ncbi:MAG: chemotaxis protein CheA, partial [Planctomycetota bacterium]
MAEVLDEDALRDFVEESREHIIALNRDLLELENRGAEADPELVNSTFRAIHTVKGLSGMLGLGSINGLAHSMEDLLATVRQGEVLVAGPVAEALFESLDLLSEMVEAAARGDIGDRDINKALDRLCATAEEARGATGGRTEGGDARTAPARGVSASVLDACAVRGMLVFRIGLSLRRDFSSSRKKMLRALGKLEGAGELVSVKPKDLKKKLRAGKKVKDIKAECIFATALPEQMLRAELGTESPEVECLRGDAGKPGPGETEARKRAAADTDLPVGPDADARPAPAGGEGAGDGAASPSAAAADDGPSRPRRDSSGAPNAIRVDVGKLDHILALVGELVIVRSRYNHIAGQALDTLAVARGASRRIMSLQSELNEVESSMSRTLNELQDAVMKARLVPLGSVFGRFRRAIRDIAAREGKRVRFESSGGETELDKKVIDQIGEPLMHLIRNAVDHGIEPPDERRRAGKPDEGSVALSARQEGDRVVLEVADDGRGLDRRRIAAKAVARGMLDAGKIDEMTDREMQEIIASPGFSTSREVTAVSGRGVGMDVVRQTLADLKGTFDIESSAGGGTIFRIRLPLTMAIVDALLVSVGNESYAIAVTSVREILE